MNREELKFLLIDGIFKTFMQQREILLCFV